MFTIWILMTLATVGMGTSGAVPVVEAISPSAWMETTTVAVTLAGAFFLGATNVTIGDEDCVLTGPPSVEPCLLQLSRVDACEVAYNLTELDQVDGMTPCDFQAQCFLATNPGTQCPFPSAVSICTLQRCYAEPPYDTCYGFVDTPDYSYCGFERACLGGECIDAKGAECPSTLECVLPATNSLSVGLHNVSVTTGGNVTTTIPAGFRIMPDLAAVDLWTPVSNLTTGVVVSPGTSIQAAVRAFTGGSELLNHTLFLEVDGQPLITAGAGCPALTTAPGMPVRSVGVRVFVRFDGLNDEVLPSRITLPVTFAQRPTVYSLCPSSVLAFVGNTIVVQGENFAEAGGLFECRVDGSTVSATVINDRTVHCIVALVDNTTAAHALQVTNDGWMEAPGAGTLTVIGACEVLKPNSAPVGDACRCNPGFSDTDVACIPCPDGTYQPDVGQGACRTCGDTKDTGGVVGNIDAGACRCKSGTILAEPGDVACTPCGAGMVCENGQLAAAEGYWRPTPTALFVLECPSGSLGCAGGNGTGDATCKKGYEGPLCSVCAPGHGKIGNTCVACGGKVVSIVVVLLAAVAALGIFVLLIKNTTNPSRASVDFSTTVKIGVSYVQVLYYVGRLSADWGALGDQFFASTAVASMNPSLYFQCAAEMGFYNRIVLTMCMPLILGAFFAIPYGIMLCGSSAGTRDVVPAAAADRWSVKNIIIEYQTSMMIVLYLIHPAITLDVLDSLQCERVRGTGTSFVGVDMSVDCGTDKYVNYRVILIFYTICYVIGGVVLVAAGMRRSRERLLVAMQVHSYDDPPTVYFVQGYTDRWYLWEGAVLARKLGVVMCSAFLPQRFQLLWGGIVIGASLAATIYLRPYKRVLSNRLDTYCLAALGVTVLIGFHALLGDRTSHLAVFVLIAFFNIAVLLLLFTTTASKLKDPIMKLLVGAKHRLCSDDAKLKNIEMHTRRSSRIPSDTSLADTPVTPPHYGPARGVSDADVLDFDMTPHKSRSSQFFDVPL